MSTSTPPTPADHQDAQSRRRAAGVPAASAAHAARAAEGHRRPGRGHRADLRGHLHARALPAGRRAGAGQDADGQHARADSRPAVQADSVHARPDALGHHGHERAGRRRDGRRTFRFVEGPIFTNILLADEINRTPPKTQAALLQAMQEREVTVGPVDLSRCPTRSSRSPRRTRSSRKAPTRCPKRSSTGSCSTSRSTIRRPTEEEQILAATTRQREAGSAQGALGAGDPEPAEAGRLGGGERVHHQVRRRAGAGDAAEGRDGAEVRPRAGRLGRRARGPGSS